VLSEGAIVAHESTLVSDEGAKQAAPTAFVGHQGVDIRHQTAGRDEGVAVIARESAIEVHDIGLTGDKRTS